MRPEFLDYESNSLDYRILNTTNNIHENNVKMRSKPLKQQSNEYRNSGSDYTNGPLGLTSSTSSGASCGTAAIGSATSNHISTANTSNINNGPNEFSPISEHNTSTLTRSGNSTLNKFRNSRNHIITDTIPGPESCV